EESISDDGEVEARKREDSKDTCAQGQIGCDFIECSSQHYKTD
ncbi:MAG: hypothetical protein QOD84_3080, partial [Acidobacteriaceae bacterium]